MNDDTTWGMWQENVVVSTGKQMAVLAFNPDLAFFRNFVPGFDGYVLNTDFNSALTTESTRRHYFDPGWAVHCPRRHLPLDEHLWLQPERLRGLYDDAERLATNMAIAGAT